MADKTPTYNDLESLNKMYDDMYRGKLGQLEAYKNNQYALLDGQDEKINGIYGNAYRTIGQGRYDTQNKYKDLYSGLANKEKDGVSNYYNERNQVSYDNAKNVQSLREYMARNNLASSGESVDGMLRNNTDFSNNMGTVKNNEQLFLRDIGDTRSRYNSEEVSAYVNYDNQLAQALSERNSALAELQGQRASIKKNWDIERQSAYNDIEAQRAKAIFDYQQAEKDRALQRELASMSGGGSYGGGSYGGGSSGNDETMRDYIGYEVERTVNGQIDFNGTKGMLEVWLSQGYITTDEYYTYLDRINSTMNAMKGAQADQNMGRPSGGTPTVGRPTSERV